MLAGYWVLRWSNKASVTYWPLSSEMQANLLLSFPPFSSDRPLSGSKTTPPPIAADKRASSLARLCDDFRVSHLGAHELNWENSSEVILTREGLSEKKCSRIGKSTSYCQADFVPHPTPPPFFSLSFFLPFSVSLFFLWGWGVVRGTERFRERNSNRNITNSMHDIWTHFKAQYYSFFTVRSGNFSKFYAKHTLSGGLLKNCFAMKFGEGNSEAHQCWLHIVGFPEGREGLAALWGCSHQCFLTSSLQFTFLHPLSVCGCEGSNY